MDVTYLPLVLKDVDFNSFYEISPNQFILTSVFVKKITVEQCPNCTYFETVNNHKYKMCLCKKCRYNLSKKATN